MCIYYYVIKLVSLAPQLLEAAPARRRIGELEFELCVVVKLETQDFVGLQVVALS